MTKLLLKSLAAGYILTTIGLLVFDKSTTFLTAIVASIVIIWPTLLFASAIALLVFIAIEGHRQMLLPLFSALPCLTMKIRTVIIVSLIYSFLLGTLNVYSIVLSHEFYYIILPFLADPIVNLVFIMNWLDLTPLPIYLIYWLFFLPIFWPIVVIILIFIKNKIVPYVILTLIYTFIISISLYRLISEPDMFSHTIHSLAIFVEPIGIIIFILGQIWLFNVLRFKNSGRLY